MYAYTHMHTRTVGCSAITGPVGQLKPHTHRHTHKRTHTYVHTYIYTNTRTVFCCSVTSPAGPLKHQARRGTHVATDHNWYQTETTSHNSQVDGNGGLRQSRVRRDEEEGSGDLSCQHLFEAVKL
jgi:hypothetical protein